MFSIARVSLCKSKSGRLLLILHSFLRRCRCCCCCFVCLIESNHASAPKSTAKKPSAAASASVLALPVTSRMPVRRRCHPVCVRELLTSMDAPAAAAAAGTRAFWLSQAAAAVGRRRRGNVQLSMFGSCSLPSSLVRELRGVLGCSASQLSSQAGLGPLCAAQVQATLMCAAHRQNCTGTHVVQWACRSRH